jgi:hypothetical protein
MIVPAEAATRTDVRMMNVGEYVIKDKQKATDSRT